MKVRLQAAIAEGDGVEQREPGLAEGQTGREDVGRERRDSAWSGEPTPTDCCDLERPIEQPSSRVVPQRGMASDMSDVKPEREQAGPRAALSRDDHKAMARLQQRLRRRVGTAITEYGLLEEGDRVLVALSGGKDSWSMLDLLLSLQRHAPIRFEMHAATVDGGFTGFDPGPIRRICAELGVTHHLLPAPIKPVIEAKPEYSPCAMCSRLRRGVLYSFARSSGFSKIALGHNLDDLLETLLMNLFYEGRLSTMPLKLFSNDGTNVVIRPMATCDERDMREYARLRGYTIVPSGCPLGLCSAPENKRVQMKELIAQLHAKAPDLRSCMLRAMKNVKSTHLLDLDLIAGKPKP